MRWILLLTLGICVINVSLSLLLKINHTWLTHESRDTVIGGVPPRNLNPLLFGQLVFK